MKGKMVFSAALIIAMPLLSSPSYAKNPCATVLCLYGEMIGQGGGSACSGPIKDYFSIIKKKHHVFSPSRTLKARKSFLEGCPSADASTVGSISSMFGRLKGFGGIL